jgi:hypothetical protein
MSQNPDDNAIPPRRRRGAQPGNLNALKHGRYLTTDHLESLVPIDPSHLTDLGKYIEMIKHFMRVTYADGLNSESVEEVRMTLHVLSLAGLTISRLANLQRRIALKTGVSPST